MVYTQVLEQVSPNPREVKRERALDYPNRNRSDDFLPSTQTITFSCIQGLHAIRETRWTIIIFSLLFFRSVLRFKCVVMVHTLLPDPSLSPEKKPSGE